MDFAVVILKLHGVDRGFAGHGNLYLIAAANLPCSLTRYQAAQEGAVLVESVADEEPFSIPPFSAVFGDFIKQLAVFAA